MSSVGVVVRVRDVQNTPPVFSGSLTGIVKEDDPIGTKIMTLHAADGDVGAPRPVKYQLMTSEFLSSKIFFFFLIPQL